MSFADETPEALEQAEIARAPSFRLLRRLVKRPVAVVAVVVILVIYGAGIFAPIVSPYGFNEPDFDNRFAGLSLEHPFGTDRLGRDTLSRLIWSAQTTVIISFAAVVTGALVFGVTAGLVAGYFGGKTDAVIMRVADTLFSVPTILLLLIINSTMERRVDSLFRDVENFLGTDWIVSSGAPSYFLVFGALAIFGWVGMARLVRSQVLSLKQSVFVTAAEASGASTPRILFLHLLPNVANLLIVGITLSLGAAAVAEVGLTFLGIGVQAPHPSFGAMIFDYSGVTNVREHPQLILFPAAVISALMLSFNLLGDVLTEELSPRRR
ncbi:MAG: ABC transporter permease [Chloroflexi bacterium]|nr:ABC transporter permease [Chloroflexota bacterium]